MNARIDELIERHLEGCATPEESAELQQTLKESAEVRARYLDYVNLDTALGTVGNAAAVAAQGAGGNVSIVHPFRFRWWSIAAAAACLILAFGMGLLPHRRPSPARPDVASVIESTKNAIAQLPPPSSPLPAWVSPTASLLDLDLSRLPLSNSNNSKQPL